MLNQKARSLLMKKLLLIATLMVLTPLMHGAASSSNGSQPASRIRSLQDLATDIVIKKLLTNNPAAFHTEESLKAAFNESRLPDYIFETSRPLIARAYYLHVQGDKTKMPQWLLEYFQGVSIQFLIDNNMIPPFEWVPDGKILYLEGMSINSFIGLQNIPGIQEINSLDLSGNLLTNIELGTFAGLNNLEYLDLGRNQLTNIQPGTFAGLNNLRSLGLG